MLQPSTEPSFSTRPSLEPLAPLAALKDTRWLIALDEIVFADRLCSDLRQAGAVVHLVDPLGLELSRLHDFDAQLVLSRPQQDLRFLRDRLLSHPGLRFASPLTFNGSFTRNEGEHRLELLRLARDANMLLSRDRAIEMLLERPPRTFSVPVREIGLSRVLRVLSRRDDVFRLRLSVEGQTAVVEMAGRLILNVVVEARGEPKLLGAEALAAAFEIEEPEALVEYRPSLLAPCFCEPIDRALVHAFAESRERRVSSDAESPTLRMRSPFAEKRVEHGEEAAKGAPQDEPTDGFLSDLISSDDTPLPAPARVPTISGIVLQQPLLEGERSDQNVRMRRRPFFPRLRTGHAIALVGSLLFALATATLILKRRDTPTRAVSSMQQRPPEKLRERVSSDKVISQEEKPLPVERPAQDRALESPREVLPEAAGKDNVDDNDPVESDNDPVESESEASEDARAFARKAQKALSHGETEEALALAERALALRPHRLPFIVLYGDALKAAGKTDEALVYYRRALGKKPLAPEILERIDRLSSQ